MAVQILKSFLSGVEGGGCLPRIWDLAPSATINMVHLSGLNS